MSCYSPTCLCSSCATRPTTKKRLPKVDQLEIFSCDASGFQSTLRRAALKLQVVLADSPISVHPFDQRISTPANRPFTTASCAHPSAACALTLGFISSSTHDRLTGRLSGIRQSLDETRDESGTDRARYIGPRRFALLLESGASTKGRKSRKITRDHRTDSWRPAISDRPTRTNTRGAEHTHHRSSTVNVAKVCD